MQGLHWVDIVLAMKRIFKFSWKTIVIRLQQKGLLDASAGARFHAQFRERYGYSLAGFGEPFPLRAVDYVDDNREPETLCRPDFPAAQLQLGALGSEALKQGKITVSRASKIFGCSIVHVRELAKDWKVGLHDWQER